MSHKGRGAHTTKPGTDKDTSLERYTEDPAKHNTATPHK